LLKIYTAIYKTNSKSKRCRLHSIHCG